MPNRSIIIGFIVGVLLGISTAAVAAAIYGDGYLLGWEVVNSRGDTICDSPFVWSAIQQIECD